MPFGNKRLKRIENEIRQGHWVDDRKWPNQKIIIGNHSLFLQGFSQHERMALLKIVKFGKVTSRPAIINETFSYPNSFQIATLEEAGMIFLKNNEYVKRKLLTLFSEIGT